MSFTGSTVVGKQLAALAGAHMKRVTMELGGHAPVIIFDDADADVAAKTMAGSKFRNAGQLCVSPARFLVQEGIYNKFLEATKALKVGNGLEASSTMGSLANPRRSRGLSGHRRPAFACAQAHRRDAVRFAAPALAAELVATQPDLVLTGAEQAVRMLAQASGTLPVVFAISKDPVGSGIAASLSRPGGNATRLVQAKVFYRTPGWRDRTSSTALVSPGQPGMA